MAEEGTYSIQNVHKIEPTIKCSCCNREIQSIFILSCKHGLCLVCYKMYEANCPVCRSTYPQFFQMKCYPSIYQPSSNIHQPELIDNSIGYPEGSNYSTFRDFSRFNTINARSSNYPPHDLNLNFQHSIESRTIGMNQKRQRSYHGILNSLGLGVTPLPDQISPPIISDLVGQSSNYPTLHECTEHEESPKEWCDWTNEIPDIPESKRARTYYSESNLDDIFVNDENLFFMQSVEGNPTLTQDGNNSNHSPNTQDNLISYEDQYIKNFQCHSCDSISREKVNNETKNHSKRRASMCKAENCSKRAVTLGLCVRHGGGKKIGYIS
jgi:hypothetical protein